MTHVTAEFGTLTARGVFQVADRKFLDRRLTRAEKRLLQAQALYFTPDGVDANTAFCCHMLSALRLKTTDPEVTPEWLDSSLTEDEIALLVTYIVQGPDGVRRALSSTPATST